MEKKTKKIIKHCGVWVFALITSACLVVILPKVALADPHAMFYTDKGQQQVFYNILAALNQADYVEPPPQDINPYQPPTLPAPVPSPTSPPNIDYNTRIGNYLATGTYYPRTDQREAKINADGSVSVGPGGSATPLEPQERTNLPRITVRQVTSDNGDAFLRETLQRRALAERMRVEFSGFTCRLLYGIYGPTAASGDSNNTNQNNEDPCKEFLRGDDLIMSR